MKYLLVWSRVRRMCTISLLAALASFAGTRAEAQSPAPHPSWAQTYFNGAHSGYNPVENTLGTSNISGLQLLWGVGVSGGVTNFAVANGVVFATGQSNNLVALNATTGAQLWITNTGGNTGINAIAAANGLVFAQCEFRDTGGNPYGAICAYKANNGRRVWQASSPCNCLPEASVQSPLVYDNGAIYYGYASGGSTQTHGIYALDAMTGASLWGYGEFSNSFGVGPPVTDGSSVYAYAGTTSQIVSLAASNGNPNWSAGISGNNAALSVSGGVVYVSGAWTGSSATIYTLEASTGSLLWSYPYGTENWCGSAVAPSPPAVAHGIVYFQGIDSNLYALHARNGALAWSDMVNTGQCGYGITSAPSVANGVVYVNGGDDGNFAANTTAYNAMTGALLWGSPSPHGTLEMPPEVVNGILYFAGPGDTICKSICAYAVP